MSNAAASEVWVGTVNPYSFNLQATLSMSSAASSNPPAVPHHPMMCGDGLRYHPDGVLECDHTQVPADDPRTQSCVDQSIAILIIELLAEREGTP